MDDVRTVSFHRRNLPHWMVADRSYFVTFRLKGTLPASVLKALEEERQALRKRMASAEELHELERRHFVRIESILDMVDNSQALLRSKNAAEIVLESFRWLRAERGWRVYALTVMPNHVHVLTRNNDGRNHLLVEDMGLLKSFTARRINRQYGTKGSVWAAENFDHWCRTNERFEAAKQYIRSNPMKAGLVKDWQNWPWTWTLDE